MASKVIAAFALVGLVAGCGRGSPRFQSGAGWHHLARDGELVAADVPLAAADRSLASPPSRTVATLPRHGIVIWALVMRRHRVFDAKFPPEPLRVDKAVATNPPEGFFCPPAARARCFEAGGAIRRMQARLSGWDIGLTIFFGTDHPSQSQIVAANAELGRLTP
jgi:hypothetical protein